MPAETPPPAERSWWLEEALEHDPGEPSPPLALDASADVVILGGCYTGLWTAYFLKERDPGMDVVLLEQDICGGGPSGRNGGFLIGGGGHPARLVPRLRGGWGGGPAAAPRRGGGARGGGRGGGRLGARPPAPPARLARGLRRVLLE